MFSSDSYTSLLTKFAAKASVVAVVAFALSGCTTPGDSDARVTLREGESLSASGDTIYRCITEKGWDVTLTWDGGIEASSETIPSAQEDLYDVDLAACVAEVDERVLRMTDDEIRAVYLLELAARECLIALGYDVEEPPTEQTYIDRFFADRWTAYGASTVPFSRLSDSEWRTISEQCRQPSWSLGAE